MEFNLTQEAVNAALQRLNFECEKEFHNLLNGIDPKYGIDTNIPLYPNNHRWDKSDPIHTTERKYKGRFTGYINWQSCHMDINGETFDIFVPFADIKKFVPDSTESILPNKLNGKTVFWAVYREEKARLLPDSEKAAAEKKRIELEKQQAERKRKTEEDKKARKEIRKAELEAKRDELNQQHYEELPLIEVQHPYFEKKRIPLGILQALGARVGRTFFALANRDGEISIKQVAKKFIDGDENGLLIFNNLDFNLGDEYLAVPMQTTIKKVDGELVASDIVNYQKIYENAKEFNQAVEGSTVGSFCLLQETTYQDPTFSQDSLEAVSQDIDKWQRVDAVLLEGVADAIHMQMIFNLLGIKTRVIIAFSAYNLLEVAKKLHEAGISFITIADFDWKHDVKLLRVKENVGLSKAIETFEEIDICHNMTYPTFDNSFDTQQLNDSEHRKLFKLWTGYTGGQLPFNDGYLPINLYDSFTDHLDDVEAYLLTLVKPSYYEWEVSPNVACEFFEDLSIAQFLTTWQIESIEKHGGLKPAQVHELLTRADLYEKLSTDNPYLPRDTAFYKKLPSDVTDLLLLERAKYGHLQGTINTFNELSRNFILNDGFVADFEKIDASEIEGYAQSIDLADNHIYKWTPGSGKTMAIIKNIKRIFDRTGSIPKVEILVPTVNTENNLADDICNKVNAVFGFKVASVVRGREGIQPGKDVPMCLKAQEMSEYPGNNFFSSYCCQDKPEAYQNLKGYDNKSRKIIKLFDAHNRPESFETCPHYGECAYLNQYRDIAQRNEEKQDRHIIIRAHDLISVADGFLSSFLPEFEYQIIDESFYEKVYRESFVNLEAWDNPHDVSQLYANLNLLFNEDQIHNLMTRWEIARDSWDLYKDAIYRAISENNKGLLLGLDFDSLIEAIKAALPKSLKHHPLSSTEIKQSAQAAYKAVMGSWAKIVKILSLLKEEMTTQNNGFNRVYVENDSIQYVYIINTTFEHTNRFVNKNTAVAHKIYDGLRKIGLEKFSRDDIAPRKCVFKNERHKENRIYTTFYLFDPFEKHTNGRSSRPRNLLNITVKEYNLYLSEGVPCVSIEMVRGLWYPIFKQGGIDSLETTSKPMQQLFEHGLICQLSDNSFELVDDRIKLGNLVYIPLTILDADANPEIIAKIFPDRFFRFQQLHVKQTNLRIEQLVSAKNSYSSLEKSDIAFNAVVEHAQRERAKGLTKFLIVGPMKFMTNPILLKLKEDLEKEGCIVQLRHFNSLRGYDGYKDFDAVITFGRNQPPFKEMVKRARAFFWQDTIDTSDVVKNEKRVIYRRTSKGEIKRKIITVQCLADRRAQLFLEQVRESELLQIAARLRAIHSITQKVWINLCSIPLPGVEVDKFIASQSTGNGRAVNEEKTEQVLSQFLDDRSMMPLAPEILASEAVDTKGKPIFKSTNQARDWLRQHGFEGLIKMGTSHIKALMQSTHFKNLNNSSLNAGLLEYRFNGRKRASYLLYLYHSKFKSEVIEASIDWLESLRGRAVIAVNYDCFVEPTEFNSMEVESIFPTIPQSTTVKEDPREALLKATLAALQKNGRGNFQLLKEELIQSTDLERGEAEPIIGRTYFLHL